jgi:carbamoyl-phosphate synthase large subunit
MKKQNLTNVLVTGVGDTVGQALVKTARHSSIPCRIVGTDTKDLSAGLHWVDRGFVVPPCTQADAFMEKIRAICAAEKVHILFPGSEKELKVLAENAESLLAETGTIVVANPPHMLRIALDKWETCRFLEKAGLNFPLYARPEVADEVERLIDACGFPLIAKPCNGTGGRGLCKVTSRQDLDAVRASPVAMVLQEYLLPDEEEHGVEVYTLKDGRQIGAICYYRRHIVAGDTNIGWFGKNEAVESTGRAVAKALRSLGPCNAQMRLTQRGPVVFEINPRFSGTVAIHAHFGFNEVEIAIRDLVLDEPVPVPHIRSGTVLRFWEETYVDDEPERENCRPRLEAAAGNRRLQPVSVRD